MILEELLPFEQITIQCHDAPDADAIASSYALFQYLKSQGKSPRLVYSGYEMISKPDLKKLCQIYHISFDYISDPQNEEPVELLVTVDCHPNFQSNENKVSLLPCKNIAIIDHHAEPDMQAMLDKLRERCGPDAAIFCEFRTSYGSCSTILWDMLCKAGWEHNISTKLATILYFGLYIDSGYFQRLNDTDNMDINMMKTLNYDRSVFDQLKYSNLHLEDLRIFGGALSHLHCSEEYPFAMAETACCSPNLLGTICDMIMGVEGLDACITYCKRPEAVKLSVRSTNPDIPADKLAEWIARDLGNGGGRNIKVAGCTLNLNQLEAVCESDFWLGRREAVGQLIFKRITSYFEKEVQRHAGGEAAAAEGSAIDLLTRQAQQGDAKAQYQLGSHYAQGVGVEQSWTEAALWYAKAAEQHLPAAQHSLGVCYAYKRGVPKDLKRAAELYHSAAESGYALAQKDLGVCYARGRGVDQSWEKAVEWYKKAAMTGNAHAQHNLAQRYARNEGVENQSHEQAFFWYHKAAEQGYSWSQEKLGDCYAGGMGTDQDWVQAVYWYTKAAEQGIEDAQKKLADCLKEGRPGVPQDLERAAYWRQCIYQRS